MRDFLRYYLWSTYIIPLQREISEVMSALKELDVYKQIEIAKELEIVYGELLERQDVSWLLNIQSTFVNPNDIRFGQS